jgi:hypothetical protein
MKLTDSQADALSRTFSGYVLKLNLSRSNTMWWVQRACANLNGNHTSRGCRFAIWEPIINKQGIVGGYKTVAMSPGPGQKGIPVNRAELIQNYRDLLEKWNVYRKVKTLRYQPAEREYKPSKRVNEAVEKMLGGA